MMVRQVQYFNDIIIRQMEIKIGKPLNELTHLLMRNNQQPTPRRSTSHNNQQAHHPTNPHPTHLLRLPQKENQPLINNLMPRSPARSVSRKATNSKEDNSFQSKDSRQRAKSRRHLPVSKPCENHEDQEGSFHILIEGEELYYCDKCANKLRNQGFPVRRQPDTNSNSWEQSNGKSNGKLGMSYPHLEGHPQFETLRTLLGQIYCAEDKIKQSQTTGEEFEGFLNQKLAQMEDFYDKMEDLLKKNREQSRISIISLKDEWQARLFEEQKTDPTKEIKVMRDDIENNIESIVGEVQEDTFKECVDNYMTRLQELTAQAQARLTDAQQVRGSLSSQFDQRITFLQQGLLKIRREITQGEQTVVTSQCEPNYFCQENQPIKGPFRNLFHEGEKEKPRKKLISRK